MKSQRLLLLLILFACWHSSSAQRTHSIVIGSVDSLFSETFQEYREIWIYVPETDQSSTPSRFPVLYLLDGDAYFHSLTGLVKQLSSFGTTVCPEMMVVAIPNTDRSRDLTPPDPADSTKQSSGAENFTAFLKDELIPYIDSRYPTLPYRTLFGHSLGGSFVINTLINHPRLFTNYLSIDPGLKFYDYRFLDQAVLAIQEDTYSDQSLFVAVANTLPEAMDTATAMQDTTWITATTRSNLKFAKSIADDIHNGLNYDWKYYADESHASISTIAEYDALKFFFSWHAIDLDKIIRTDPTISGKEFMAKVTAHFEEVSRRLNHQVLPPQELVNDLGYYYLEKEAYQDAYLFFSLNLNHYPENAIPYDSMGEWYAAQSKNNKAIEYFTKAAAKGSPTSKEKLERFQDSHP